MCFHQFLNFLIRILLNCVKLEVQLYSNLLDLINNTVFPILEVLFAKCMICLQFHQLVEQVFVAIFELLETLLICFKVEQLGNILKFIQHILLEFTNLNRNGFSVVFNDLLLLIDLLRQLFY